MDRRSRKWMKAATSAPSTRARKRAFTRIVAKVQKEQQQRADNTAARRAAMAVKQPLP